MVSETKPTKIAKRALLSNITAIKIAKFHIKVF